MSSPVVIDASLAVACVVRTPYSAQAAGAMEHWMRAGAQFYAPGIWWYEVTSVIHRYHFAGLITDAMAYAGLEILTSQWEIHRVDVAMRSAFDWATRLRQKAAYDGFYLAAAESLGAELWTADQALVNNARQVGAGWVRWIGEQA